MKAMTRVRLADPDADFPAILDGARDFVSRMDFTGHLPPDEAGLGAAMSRIFSVVDLDLIVVEEAGRIVGGLGMVYAPYLWNPAILSGEELFFWTARQAPAGAALRLIRFMQRRAAEKGVRVMSFAALTSSPATLGRLYERLGMRKTQTTYTGVM